MPENELAELKKKIDHYTKIKTCECGKQPQKFTTLSKSGNVWSSVTCECGLTTHNYYGEVRSITAWNEGLRFKVEVSHA